jgi:hypothetical protein
VKSIFRYAVPVDDEWHTLTLSGPIVHVATRHVDFVEVWATTNGTMQYREFRVFGTGHPWPEDAGLAYVGTAIAPGGALVWHLVERPIITGI